ncbi:hypothetical protein PV08_08698 [Exophiala spinifera]|uniref:Uncharacterized protein n=1 Tax=Exophiala spinifera TaxID=91928 RepID=A0A0D2B4D1_9EURO|nr:uncharacterized protein PV08_08698 [Exophiala spinifera]KIW13510.1 hypothetical protein PV08_08698 [Exophiala spinifera]
MDPPRHIRLDLVSVMASATLIVLGGGCMGEAPARQDVPHDEASPAPWQLKSKSVEILGWLPFQVDTDIGAFAILLAGKVLNY